MHSFIHYKQANWDQNMFRGSNDNSIPNWLGTIESLSCWCESYRHRWSWFDWVSRRIFTKYIFTLLQIMTCYCPYFYNCSFRSLIFQNGTINKCHRWWCKVRYFTDQIVDDLIFLFFPFWIHEISSYSFFITYKLWQVNYT